MQGGKAFGSRSQGFPFGEAVGVSRLKREARRSTIFRQPCGLPPASSMVVLLCYRLQHSLSQAISASLYLPLAALSFDVLAKGGFFVPSSKAP